MNISKKAAIVLASLALTTGLATANPAPATAASASICSVVLGGDYAHISSSDGPRATQGHGWWAKSLGDCSGWRLRVTVTVQVKTTFLWWDVWGTVGKSTATWVKPGGGAGNRATGRYVCTNSATTNTYRTVIQGDLQRPTGIWAAAPGAIITATRSLKCGWSQA